MRHIYFSKSALENIEETSTEAHLDLVRVNDGLSVADLLVECLNGADPDRVQGWRDYCHTIREAHEARDLGGSEPTEGGFVLFENRTERDQWREQRRANRNQKHPTKAETPMTERLPLSNFAPYSAGYADGLAWDLDGYASSHELQQEHEGWDAATINAIGRAKFLERVGLPAGEGPEFDAAFSTACSEYNRGARDGALAPQGRTGLPIGAPKHEGD